MSRETELKSIINIHSKIGAKIVAASQRPDEDLFWDDIRIAHDSVECLAIHLRRLIRASSPYVNAHTDCDDTIGNVAYSSGYGVETTPEGWLRVVLPPLLSSRRYRRNSNIDQLRGMLRAMLWRYSKENEDLSFDTKQTVIFKYILAPAERPKDHDNQEVKAVIDEIKNFYLQDDSMDHIHLHQCGQRGKDSFVVVYVMAQNDFVTWLSKQDQYEEKLLGRND